MHVIYRHIPISAEKNSRDPNKSRPEWFKYKTCFHNLLTTIRSDPMGANVKLLILFDGTPDEFLEDFIATYYANPDLGLSLQLIKGGSNGNSFLIALAMLSHSDIPDDDLIYFLENDYMHQHGWVSKTFEIFNSKHPVDFVSLYDHRDKYDFEMYDDLTSKIVYSDTHHWRTAPSTCGTFILEKGAVVRDYDLWTSNLVDYILFPTLINDRKRMLLTPVPGLATHCMQGYLSPTIDWDSLARQAST